MELKELLCLLEAKLVEHDNSRKKVQNQLEDICSRMMEEADSLNEMINEELHESLCMKETQIINLTEKLTSQEEGSDELGSLIKQARKELSYDLELEIEHSIFGESFADSYVPITIRTKRSNNAQSGNTVEDIVKQLHEHLGRIYDSMVSTQDKLAQIVDKRRNEIEDFKNKINTELETHFSQEDARIQKVVNLIKKKSTTSDPKSLAQKALLTLFKGQKYSLQIRSNDNYDLIVSKEISLKWINFEERKPSNVVTTYKNKGEFSLSFLLFNDDEVSILKPLNFTFKVTIRMREKGKEDDNINRIVFTKECTNIENQSICFSGLFKSSTTYFSEIKIDQSDLSTKWSDEFEFTTPEFNKLCFWKECPGYVSKVHSYFIKDNNPRIGTKVCDDYDYCTIIGNTPLPLDNTTSWNINILNSKKDDGKDIYIGVAPFDINQDEENYIYNKCGWYFDCYGSTLWSGPPHRYRGKYYETLKRAGEYVHTGGTIGVVIDTTIKDELSFAVNNVNYGVAYKGIPLDKPLVPCVILRSKGDSVELVFSKMKEDVDSSIQVPSNITTKSITWYSITLIWDAVEGASFYQIEVDGRNSLYVSTINIFIKSELLSESDHSFRVRTVKGNRVSKWSDIATERTTKGLDFSKCAWEKCPDNVEKKRKYSHDEKDPRIAKMVGDDWYEYCTIIGNTHLPLNKVTSWNIEILKTEGNDGANIFIGLAPIGIDQNQSENQAKCGWYFDCYRSTLWSGPPHNYWKKVYGPRKEEGTYVHKGSIISVVMDTTKGELSFALDGVNCGVGFEGIPLDKPLVPCVLLYYRGDSVKILT